MHRLKAQHGLTLVELMVGMAIGLIVIAVALTALAQHLRETQRLLAEARMTHDLQATLDLISRDLRRAGPLSVQTDGVRFSAAGSAEPLAYRLQDGVISMKIGDGSWQAMTDPQTLRIAALRITPQVEEIVLAEACSRACDDSTPQCPPRQQLRHVALEVTASAAQGTAWTRTAFRTVQLRHDALVGACPA